MGGTLRLGAYPCILKPGTFAATAYGQEEISERHRHRYEFNNAYRQQLEEAGLIVSGTSPDQTLVEMGELADHPWFLGCQFHPEFQSVRRSRIRCSCAFIKAAITHKKENKAEQMINNVSIGTHTPVGPISVGPGTAAAAGRPLRAGKRRAGLGNCPGDEDDLLASGHLLRVSRPPLTRPTAPR